VTCPAEAHRIRPARWRDRRAIRQLIDAAYVPLLEPLGLLQSLRRIPLWWHTLNRRFWVLENGQELVGVIGLHDYSIQLFIFLVAVLPGVQGRGLGRTLIEFAETEARHRGFYRLRLTTPEGFVNAIEFYRHLGFIEVTRRNQRGHVVVDMIKRWGKALER
jgi:GNAT superfamily N-acetyltransferase